MRLLLPYVFGFSDLQADILQPGPAALTDGVKPIHRTVMDWAVRHG